MRAYEGYLEDGRFTPIGETMNIRGRRRVILTVFDETIQPSVKEQELRAQWLKRLDAAISLSMDEDLPDMTRSALLFGSWFPLSFLPDVTKPFLF